MGQSYRAGLLKKPFTSSQPLLTRDAKFFSITKFLTGIPANCDKSMFGWKPR